jgi:hypothetical protein
MNSTYSPTQDLTVTIVNNGIVYLTIIFIFFGMMTLVVVKLLLKQRTEVQIASPVVIEIPMAVSISTQTVDNEHIGVVV